MADGVSFIYDRPIYGVYMEEYKRDFQFYSHYVRGVLTIITQQTRKNGKKVEKKVAALIKQHRRRPDITPPFAIIHLSPALPLFDFTSQGLPLLVINSRKPELQHRG